MTRRKLTHGSLFTGVGGIDLGFDAAGIRTLWQCEQDKRCQSVLRRHWPKAELYDDVSALNGAELKPVDIITFGSPCQDLSIAGKRQGMKKGTRSNLYYEATRIIREMREATDGKYPQYAVWENVRGALSSREGRDFQKALEELANIGALDIAWRVVNTANFGPPQRRVRVFVVADFRGRRAGEILSQPTRVLWHPPTCKEAQQEAAGEAEGSTGSSSWRTERSITQALLADTGGVCVPEAQAGQLVWAPGVSAALTTRCGNVQDDQQTSQVVVIDGYNQTTNSDVHPPLRSHKDSGDSVLIPGYRVRRLTPRECERLQGWPDDHTRYTDTDVELKDGPRFKMIGNGVSAPVAQWLGENIVAAR